MGDERGEGHAESARRPVDEIVGKKKEERRDRGAARSDAVRDPSEGAHQERDEDLVSPVGSVREERRPHEEQREGLDDGHGDRPRTLEPDARATRVVGNVIVAGEWRRFDVLPARHSKSG